MAETFSKGLKEIDAIEESYKRKILEQNDDATGDAETIATYVAEIGEKNERIKELEAIKARLHYALEDSNCGSEGGPLILLTGIVISIMWAVAWCVYH